MKLTLGVHLLLAANDKGGASKSTYAAEARVACTLLGIPFRLVTFDGSNQTLNCIFRSNGVHCLAKPNGDILLDTFGWHIDEARKGGEIIIADMPPGITDSDNPIMKAFSDSQIHADFASIGLLVPVFTHSDHIGGALDALAAFKAAGIKHDRGLIRAWRPEPTSPKWESFPTFESLKALFPIWDCSSFMQSMADMMQATGNFTGYPALDKLPKMFAEDAQTMSTRERGQLRAAVGHLEKAKDAIFEHLLKPIIEKPAKSAKSE